MTAEVNFDHLVKVVSVRCLHSKGTVFSFIINEFLIEVFPVVIQLVLKKNSVKC